MNDSEPLNSNHFLVKRDAYQEPAFFIDEIELVFDLNNDSTKVQSKLSVRRNKNTAYQGSDYQKDFHLNGCELSFHSVYVNSEPLNPTGYRLSEKASQQGLSILNVPDDFTLETVVTIEPQKNTSLMGLFNSEGTLVTQCEAEGFRRLTWFCDRPDILSLYKVTLIANKEQYPVLLSNGNLTEQGDLDNNRHWACWHDPIAKSCYIFALVAGQLSFIEDTHQRGSQQDVCLRVWAPAHELNKTQHAMTSLKKAMSWEKETYALDYDLNDFNLVILPNFMGAQENKGLNIYSAHNALANPETSTDVDYMGKEIIIGHEYFHNWSGNRVTCRDWFQLTLKEGLTIYRQWQFSQAVGMADMKRIWAIKLLRSEQFPEEQGPLAHALQPDSYMSVDNFYTATIYRKGGEVVRMLHTLLGDKEYYQGCKHYFSQFDQQAVTVDDFVNSFESFCNFDLKQFKRWYTQVGTPKVTVLSHYDTQEQRFTITLRQSPMSTVYSGDYDALVMPIKIGLIDEHGGDFELNNQSDILIFDEIEQEFVFENVSSKPVLSILRGFSATVVLDIDYSETELTFLLSHDSDAVNRWLIAQQYASEVILTLVEKYQSGKELVLSEQFIAAFSSVITDGQLDPSVIAQILTLPTVLELSEQVQEIDIQSIYIVREYVLTELAKHMSTKLLERFNILNNGEPYSYNSGDVARRSLKNCCLSYLIRLDEGQYYQAALKQLHHADNMTDSMAALEALVNSNCSEKDEGLIFFANKWQDNDLVMDKWFRVQALSEERDTLAQVKLLLSHPCFSFENASRVRALLTSFCVDNKVAFHQEDGQGYSFLADMVIKIDQISSKMIINSRLLDEISRWRLFPLVKQVSMKTELERVISTHNLSSGTYELVSKILQD